MHNYQEIETIIENFKTCQKTSILLDALNKKTEDHEAYKELIEKITNYILGEEKYKREYKEVLRTCVEKSKNYSDKIKAETENDNSFYLYIVRKVLEAKKGILEVSDLKEIIIDAIDTKNYENIIILIIEDKYSEKKYKDLYEEIETLDDTIKDDVLVFFAKKYVEIKKTIKSSTFKRKIDRKRGYGLLEKLKDFFKKNFALLFVCFCWAVGIFAVVLLILSNIVDTSTITINSPEKIEIVYGEQIDFNSIYVEYEHIIGDKHKEILTIDNLEGYNPIYNVGIYNAKINYDEVSKDIIIKVVPKQLEKTDQLNIVDGILQWRRIEKADYYNVYIGKENEDASMYLKTDATSLNLIELDVYGDYYAKVSVGSNNENYKTSDYSDSFSFNKIGKIQNIRYENGMVKWDEAQDAQTYQLTINGEEYITTNNFYQYALKEGENKIIIKAISSIQTSVPYKTEIKKFQKLEGVNSFIYDGEYVSWAQITGADQYEIFIDDNLYKKQAETKFSAKNLKDSHLIPGVHKISIIPISESGTYIEANKVDFYALINVTAEISDGILNWNNLGEGFTYKLLIDGLEKSTLITSSSINLKNLDLSPGEHTVKIEVETDKKLYINSTIPINMLIHAPPTITYNNGAFETISEGEIKYYINDIEFSGTIGELEAGTYNVYAKRMSTANNELTSNKSNIITIKKYASPVIKNENGILITEGQGKIKYYLNGVEFDGILASLEAGTHEITAKVIAQSQYELDSEISNVLTITKHASPTITYNNGVFETISEGEIKYYINDIEFSGTIGELEAGTYNVYAKRMSTANNELTSNKSNIITIKKYASPVIKNENGILITEGEGKIKYYLNGVEFDGILSSLEAGTHEITAKVIAQSKYELDSKISKVLTITKHASPTITYNNGVFETISEGEIKYYINDIEFSGTIGELEAGTYNVYAKRMSTGKDELTSNKSNVISITKLATPTVTFDGKEMNINIEWSNVIWYADGEEFDGNLDNLSRGYHTITCRLIKEEETEIDSNLSNEIIVFIPDAKITCEKFENGISSKNKIILKFGESDATKYEINVSFWDSDQSSYIGEAINYPNHTGDDQIISYNRGGKLAAYVSIKITLYGNQSNFYNKTIEILYSVN